jgi:hypothetical protein
MPKYSSSKVVKRPKKGAAQRKAGVYRSAMSGRFLSSSEDVAEFEAAARSFAQANTVSKESARAALQKMGIITSAGSLTKHYK